MALKSANGTLWIVPNQSSYDICLSGQSLDAEMTPFMKRLCGSNCTSYKQTKPKPYIPYWRVEDFQRVKKAVYRFASGQRGAQASSMAHFVCLLLYFEFSSTRERNDIYKTRKGG